MPNFMRDMDERLFSFQHNGTLLFKLPKGLWHSYCLGIIARPRFLGTASLGRLALPVPWDGEVERKAGPGNDDRFPSGCPCLPTEHKR